jgi:hypothetical protein
MCLLLNVYMCVSACQYVFIDVCVCMSTSEQVHLCVCAFRCKCVTGLVRKLEKVLVLSATPPVSLSIYICVCLCVSVCVRMCLLGEGGGDTLTYCLTC